jgi:hypothetical protein
MRSYADWLSAKVLWCGKKKLLVCVHNTPAV